MSLSDFAVKAPVKVTMIFIAVLMLGWISLDRLPTNLFPDIRAPRVTMTVRTKGLSPAEVERRICEVIERSVYSIRGVIGVQTIARSDTAVVIVNFDWDTDLDFAYLEVKKAASDLQRDRRDDVESVGVLRYDPNAVPVVTLALVGGPDADPESVYRTADQTLKPRFEQIEGVANVVLTGGSTNEIRVSLDEATLLAYDLDVGQIVEALKADNVDATGGWVEEGARRFLLKTVGQFRDPSEVSRVVVTRRGDRPVTLADVAKVSIAPAEAKSIVYFDRQPAVGLAFYREAEGNTVAVAESIRKAIEEAQKILPAGWKLHVANDQSAFIKSAIDEVRSNAVLGGVLAIVILLLFLRDFRTTMIVAIAIPVSIIATFNLMYFQGLSLNLMSLGGLALGSGMLVDNSIVVIENIFRLRQSGMSAREAAIAGTREVGGALVASTLTTVAVFLPIVYVKGIAALFFKEQALTVTYSLLASLLVALLLIPMLCAYFLGGAVARLGVGAPLAIPRGIYPATLRLALRLRWVVLGLGVVSLFAAAHFLRSVPREFMPATQESQLSLRITLPNGTPIEVTDRVLETITAQLDRYKPAIESVYTSIGEAVGVVDANTEDPDGPNTADMMIRLRNDDKPTTEVLLAGLANFRSQDLIRGLKPILDQISDARIEFRQSQGSLSEMLGTSAAPLVVELAGPELDELTRLAAQVRLRLEQSPSLVNVRTNILEGSPEVLIRLDKGQLSRYGLDVNTVASVLRRRIDGEVATQVRQESGDVDIRVEVDYGTESIDTIRNILFKTSTGSLVRLAAVGEITVERGPREIVRKRQERVAYVYADLVGGLRLSQGIDVARAAIADLAIPARYSVAFTGEEEQRAEAFGDLLFALLLSIALVYMVMASIFESFLQPLLIMLTIPLAGVGVAAALLLGGQTLNVMSIIGIVMLGGIVVNNAIVLLDCVNQVRAQAGKESRHDLSPTDTLVIGCAQRFRPVLMTTATTLLGLLPMAIGLGSGAELRQALALTVLGGLISSTILTLYVIPCTQSVLDSAIGLVRRLYEQARHRPAG